MYPRAEAPAVRCPSPSESPAASVVPGRREQRELTAAAAAATAASGSEVHLVGEGAGRHHPDPDAGADHAVVVHPGRADGRRGGAAEEAVVEAAGAGAVVVSERAGGGVVEVADLRRVVVVVVVVRGAHGRRRVGRVRVGCSGGRAVVARREEGDGPRGEEVLGGGVGAGARGVASPRAAPSAASASPAAAAAEPLHALEVEAVLLEVGGDVLAREAVHAHQLHYRLGHGVLDAEVRNGVDEPLVELRRPDQARPLQRPGRLVAGAATAAGARGGGRATAAAVHVRAAPAAASAGASPRAAAATTRPAAAAVRRDVEGDGEIGRDERLGERHQLVRPGKLLLAAREPAGLLLLPHGRGSSPAPLLTPPQSNSCSSLESSAVGGGGGSSTSTPAEGRKQQASEEGGKRKEGLLRGGSLFFQAFPRPFSLSSLLLVCVCVWAFSSPPAAATAAVP
ncbi:unnamed protein product [Urochloa decumbens]|uniref:Uncharacterized protein n=1 Tax=Urochloa decumbens TaxID=240449 RepID=A0ABC9GJX2_9POAL